jgi:hypothetical protein
MLLQPAVKLVDYDWCLISCWTRMTKTDSLTIWLLAFSTLLLTTYNGYESLNRPPVPSNWPHTLAMKISIDHLLWAIHHIHWLWKSQLTTSSEQLTTCTGYERLNRPPLLSNWPHTLSMKVSIDHFIWTIDHIHWLWKSQLTTTSEQLTTYTGHENINWPPLPSNWPHTLAMKISIDHLFRSIDHIHWLLKSQLTTYSKQLTTYTGYESLNRPPLQSNWPHILVMKISIDHFI